MRFQSLGLTPRERGLSIRSSPPYLCEIVSGLGCSWHWVRSDRRVRQFVTPSCGHRRVQDQAELKTPNREVATKVSGSKSEQVHWRAKRAAWPSEILQARFFVGLQGAVRKVAEGLTFFRLSKADLEAGACQANLSWDKATCGTLLPQRLIGSYTLGILTASGLPSHNDLVADEGPRLQTNSGLVESFRDRSPREVACDSGGPLPNYSKQAKKGRIIRQTRSATALVCR